MSIVNDIVAQNRAGAAVAIASVCSAQPDVLSASLLLAQQRGRPILVEATSNQVNQFGGYTGMIPAGFIAYVKDLAQLLHVDADLIVFGGDHLGPQVWREEDAGSAMAKASTLMRAYVEAGFTKIHLDCSEGCKGEAAQVDDETSATRAARLAAVCERYAPDPAALCYVIGTEVPPPGGARADEVGQPVTPTPPDRARATIARHHAAFLAEGLAETWARVVGLVVQPGLEFAPAHIDHFDMTAPDHLSTALAGTPNLAFEAHSTDYQKDAVFPDLASRHFAVLKVGPALTFAYRQALYSLDALSAWVTPARSGHDLADAMEAVMIAKPGHWHKHYDPSAGDMRLLRHFSYADRIRYYWPEAAAQSAVVALFTALENRVPDPVLGQYFAPQVIHRAKTLEVAAGSWSRALVWSQIQNMLDPYLFGPSLPSPR